MVTKSKRKLVGREDERICEIGMMVVLTPKQKRFVEEYLIDLNATQAAIRAGYSEKTAQEQGSVCYQMLWFPRLSKR